MTSGPDNRSLQTPAFREPGESLLADWFVNTIEPDRGVLAQPVGEATFVAAIRANFAHPWEDRMVRRHQPFTAFGIRDIGRMHQHSQEKAIRVNPTLAL